MQHNCDHDFMYSGQNTNPTYSLRNLSQVYTIKWRNNTAKRIWSGYLQYKLDPGLQLTGSNPGWTNLGNNTYKYELGNIEPLATGSLPLNIYVLNSNPAGELFVNTGFVASNDIQYTETTPINDTENYYSQLPPEGSFTINTGAARTNTTGVLLNFTNITGTDANTTFKLSNDGINRGIRTPFSIYNI